MTHPPLDLEELAKLANDRIQFVKDTELDFQAGGDTRLAEGVLRLLAECERLRAALTEAEKALEYCSDNICKHTSELSPGLNREWCHDCSSWVYKSDWEGLKAVKEALAKIRQAKG